MRNIEEQDIYNSAKINMEATSAKIVSMILLGGISLFLGLLPLLLKKCNVVGQSTSSRRGKFVVSAMSCFGGGVILATCFTHMLPEVNTFMKKNIQEGHFPDTGMLCLSSTLSLHSFSNARTHVTNHAKKC